MKILARFLRFILKLKKTYTASLVSSNGSLLLRITFASERGYNLYRRDLESGEIGRQILKVLLFPPHLASFNLKAEDLIVYLNDHKITQEQAQMTTAKSHLEENRHGSPLVHMEMCEFHDLRINLICEDCDEFICAECAKTDHRDHNWKTLTSAATQRRRNMQEFLKKIMEEDLPGIDEKMEKIPQQITENKELCDSEIKKLQKHYDEIITRLSEIRKNNEQRLRDSLEEKNDQLNHVKSELEKKKKGIVDTVEFIEENNSTMSDYSLIDYHRELRKTLSEIEVQMTNCEHSLRFNPSEINENLLDSLTGKTLHLDDLVVTRINSFQYGNNAITMLETFSEDQCYIRENMSEYTGKVNKEGEKEQIININPYDMCVTD
ncbi:tripartite motif-containing protein 75-like [Saccostrea cucullata]|uniref:tripartite motif-containing protein 75-like n=1 Tax=Saccostrea cuccullata TaxID=36930 RepID=UPI002ED0E97A